MTYAESSRRIKALLAEYSDTNPDDWYLCLKARFAMSLTLKALKSSISSRKKHVITTPFTCITAVNPIIANQFIPIYAPLDAQKLNFKSPEKLIDSKTAAVILQNTFGMVPPAPFYISRTKTAPLIIEDAAHSPAQMIRSETASVFADVSIHSFGVEKILPTKFGAAIYVNPELKNTRPDFYKNLTNSLKRLHQPGPILSLKIITYRYMNALINRFAPKRRPAIRSCLSKLRLLEAAIKPYELTGHQDSPFTTSNFANKEILKALSGLTKNLHQRTQNTSYLSAGLKDCKKIELIEHNSNAPLLVLPILAKNKKQADKLYDYLTANGFYIRRWYQQPLYPGPAGPNIAKNVYHYNPSNHPVMEEIKNRILCLPTDLSSKRTEKLIELINAF